MKEGLSSIKYMAFQFSTELSEQNIQNQFFCGFARNLPVSICNGTLSHLNLPYITNLPKVNILKLVMFHTSNNGIMLKPNGKVHIKATHSSGAILLLPQYILLYSEKVHQHKLRVLS